MNEELISQVEELGLSEKEARVYIANLMIGPSSVQKIADYAAIKRVTTYVILESLVNLGLVSQTTKGKKTLFIAEEPLSLKRLLEKKERELKQQQVNFETIMPELAALKSLPKEAPNVKFYDSAEGIKSVMKTFFASQKLQGGDIDMIYGITNVDQLYAFFPEIREAQGNPTRISSGIKSRIIYTSSEGAIYKNSDPQKMRESRWVPFDQYPLNSDITVVGDNIILLTLTGSRPIGITIHSHELAVGMKAFFDLSWAAAEKYNQ